MRPVRTEDQRGANLIAAASHANDSVVLLDQLVNPDAVAELDTQRLSTAHKNLVEESPKQHCGYGCSAQPHVAAARRAKVQPPNRVTQIGNLVLDAELGQEVQRCRGQARSTRLVTREFVTIDKDYVRDAQLSQPDCRSATRGAGTHNHDLGLMSRHRLQHSGAADPRYGPIWLAEVSRSQGY
jgi:hypothetical protein